MNRASVRRLLCSLLAMTTLGSVRLAAQDAAAAAQAPPSLLAQEPQTPQEVFNAVLVMLRLNREDLAKVYLQQFLASDPDDELLLNLRDEQGTSTFLRLSRIEALQPQSQQLLQRMQAAATRKFEDPAYFDSLLNQLEQDPRNREAAITALKQFGGDAVPALLDRLGQGRRAEQHSLLLYTLTRMGQPAVDPLLGALEAPSERIRALAAEALGWLGSAEIVPYLWYTAFGADQPPLVQQAARQAIARIRYGSPDRASQVVLSGVAPEVRELALRHFRGEGESISGEDGQVALWSWDPQQNRLVKTTTSPARTSAFRAQRLARQAMLLAPADMRNRALFLAASLAEAGYGAGWDQPWPIGPGTAHNLAMFAGTELTEEALQLAIGSKNAAAAVGALKVLGQIASESALVERYDRPSAIVAALDYPHDRVQFAAASCILQIDPAEVTHGYRIVAILARALSDAGGAASVVIDPNSERGASVAALLNAIGYDATVALTGREGFKAASSRGDVTLAVVHPNAIGWELTQTVANFRADSRTAGIPIAIYGPQPIRRDLQWLLNRTSDSKFIVTGGDAGDWRQQLASLVNAVDVPPLTPRQRAERRAAAAYWLRHIAEGCRTALLDLTPAEEALSAAIEDPAIAADALAALAAIPRASVQQRLAETVTAPAHAIEIREMAAYELANHIQEFGRLLTQSNVGELQSVWQTTDDPRVKTALTMVLGSLGTTADAVGTALESYALPTTP